MTKIWNLRTYHLVLADESLYDNTRAEGVDANVCLLGFLIIFVIHTPLANFSRWQISSAGNLNVILATVTGVIFSGGS